MARVASLRQYNGGDSKVPSLVLDFLRRQNTKPFLQSSLVYLGWEGVREWVGGSQFRRGDSPYCPPAIYVVCSRIGPNTMTQQKKLIKKKETLQVIRRVSPIW